MLYTLFYKLLFVLTHIVYLSSSVHIGLDFYTGCIAFSAVDVHKYLTSPPQVDAKGTSILPKAILVVQSPWPAPTLGSVPRRGCQLRGSACYQSSTSRRALQVATLSVSQYGGSARCPALILYLSPLQS